MCPSVHMTVRVFVFVFLRAVILSTCRLSMFYPLKSNCERIRGPTSALPGYCFALYLGQFCVRVCARACVHVTWCLRELTEVTLISQAV